MKCPICAVELKITDRQGIEIDYCPQCRGIWLDRGELDKLLERSGQDDSKAPAHQTTPPMYHRYDDDDDHDKSQFGRKATGKRKSFLGELFDF